MRDFIEPVAIALGVCLVFALCVSIVAAPFALLVWLAAEWAEEAAPDWPWYAYVALIGVIWAVPCLSSALVLVVRDWRSREVTP